MADTAGGFFDQLQNDPGTYGLLAAGLGILGNSRGPNAGNAIGLGALQGLQAAQSAQQSQAINQYRQAQVQKLNQDAQKQGVLLNVLKRLNPTSQGAPSGQAAPNAAGAPLAGTVPAASPSALPSGPDGSSSGGTNAAPSSGFPLSLGDVTALKLAGVDLMPQFKYAHDGVQRQPGSFYDNPVTGQREFIPQVPAGFNFTTGPDGKPQLALIPGYVQGNAQIEGSKAASVAGAQLPFNIAQNRDQQNTQAGLDLVPVPDGKGGTKMMPRSQAVAALNGTTQPGSLGTTPSQADQDFNNSVAQASAKTYNDLQTAGMNAPGKIANYQRVGQLLDGFDGGSLSNVGMQGAKLANSLGIQIDPQLPAKEAAVAIGNQLALQLRDPSNGGGMPGSMSDADRNFLTASVPGLNQTNEGRKQLIDYQTKVLQRQQDVAQFARKWRQKYGRLDSTDPNGNDFQAALSAWSTQNPLFPQTQK
jgi:hypothetical protein